jgi:hypothetical protein
MSDTEPAAGEPVADGLTPGARRFLRYWALNMRLVQLGSPGSWPLGFSYDDDEARRLAELAAGVSRDTFLIWLAATVVIYIVSMGSVMVAVMGFVLTVVWPHAGKLQEGVFFTALALVLALGLAVGMPASIQIGGWTADAMTHWSGPPPAPADAPLHAKVRRQFQRMALVVAALTIVAALVWGVMLTRLGL